MRPRLGLNGCMIWIKGTTKVFLNFKNSVTTPQPSRYTVFELITKGCKLKVTSLRHAVNNQVVRASRLIPLPVVADNMRTRDRFKPQQRLEPRPEALPKPQISRTVRGVRPAENTGQTPPARSMLSATTSS